MKNKQMDRVLKYIEEHGSITQDEADMLKIKRLAARIKDIRDSGVEIITDTMYGKNEYGPFRYARYRRA